MIDITIKGYPPLRVGNGLASNLVTQHALFRPKRTGYHYRENYSRTITAQFLIAIRRAYHKILKVMNASGLVWCMVIRKIPVGIEVPTLNIYLAKPIFWVDWKRYEDNENPCCVEVGMEIELANGERVTLREHEYSTPSIDVINELVQDQAYILNEYEKKGAFSTNFKDRVFYLRTRGLSMHAVYSLLLQQIEKRNIIYFEARPEVREHFFD